MLSISTRIKMLLFTILLGCALISFSGCSGSDSSDTGTVLNVVMETSVLSQGKRAMPINADKFLVEVLDSAGKELQAKEAASSSEGNTTVSFTLADTGTYRVRVSAFDVNRVILGTYNEAVTVVEGDNSVDVNTLEAAEVHYSSGLKLPQTQSAEGLSDFFSFDQSGIHLQSYCIFGKLVEEGKPVNAYMSIVQRLDEEIPDFGSYMFPIVIAGAGFNNPETAHIIFGGSYGIAELTEAVTVTQPWHAHVESPNTPPTPYPNNTTDMMLLSGVMGQKGARYKITSQTKDLEDGALETSVEVTDVMGIVNDGYGPASFFPQWLSEEQRAVINSTYGGSVGDYLEASGIPMTDQGSYYYSAPMLQVDSFTITRNGQTISQGNDGLLWMDIVYQSFDAAAQEVIKSATWNFFTLQFPDENLAMMVTSVHNDSNGDLPVATLFSTTGTKSANGALNSIYRWNLQDIKIEPVSGKTWTSPASNLTYYTQYKITLGGEHKADLTVTMSWDEQELKVNDTVKYEGYADVSGTLDGKTVSGSSWVELQPAGHL